MKLEFLEFHSWSELPRPLFDNLKYIKIMKKTENSPATIIRPTMEERIRIFMQYPGQMCHPIPDAEFIPFPMMTVSGNGWVWHEAKEFEIEAEKCCIELKPLGDISDEDAKHLFVLAGWTEPNEIKRQELGIIEGRWLAVPNTNFVHPRHLRQNQADYLRKKGFAVMFENYSVEQLVEVGIYKIIQK